MVFALMGLAIAIPTRSDQIRRIEWQPQDGREADTLIIKFTDESGLHWSEDGLQGQLPATWKDLLSEAAPRFSRAPEQLQQRQERYDPKGRLTDLRTYIQIRTMAPETIARELENDPRVEHLYLAFAAVSPPIDIPPQTPDYAYAQLYAQAAPIGFDSEYARFWPNGDGSGIRIVDIEYSWDPTHEDLGHGPQSFAWGWDIGEYAYHGNGVLGQLIAADNGYGVRGMVTGAEVLMISPLSDPGNYNVADAIEQSATFLQAGDILLIEQQALAFDNYCPVEIAPDVFDAITHLVAQGVVVVEPGGNGAQDLDAEYWDGWFQRDIQDSGAIMVGGGTPPGFNAPVRSWFSGGSSYGSRMDVQGWYVGIVTTGGEAMSDLFFPEADARQAYTAYFGGTSGASPMVVSVAAIANAIRLQRTGEVWDPVELRAAMVYSGIPQPEDDEYLIGPQPDLRRFLWMWALR